MKTLRLLIFATLISGNLLSQPAYWMFDWVTRKTPLNDSFNAGILKAQYELDVQATNSYWCGLYPNATLEGNSTRAYNCHAYAWHVKNGGGNVWINTPDDDKYWGTYGGYTEIGSAAKGETIRISYVNDDHSAVGTDELGTFVSKWGEGPLMRHSAADCPYTSGDYSYYWVPITGDNLNCSSESYSTLSISGASTYTWAGDKMSISGSGNSVTATITGNGAGWIHAEIYSPYSGTTISSEKSVWAGIPIVAYVVGSDYVQPNIPYLYYTYPPNEPLSSATYSWQLIPSIGSIYSSYDYADITFDYPDLCRVIAEATNTCGYSYGYLDVTISDEEYYTLSPNPASEEVTISVYGLKVTTNEPVFSINVFNMFGILQSKYIRSGKSFSIPLGNLQDGNYIIRINNGKQIVSKQLIVKH
jgi:hypothetical protein